ncbi:hypothetical protein DX926_19825 [Bacillus atrophaeus]|nr:hypothetical protein DX926_19825 [Bacillus atrophaeus]
MTKDFIIYYFIIICEKLSIKLSHYFKLLGICQRHWVSAQKKTKASKAFARQSYLWSQGGSNP